MQLLGEVAAGSKTANTDIFTDIKAPVPSGEIGFVVVFVNVGSAAKVKFTKDGINYYEMNNGTALTADVAFSETFPVKNGDILNFQVDTTVQVDEFDVGYYD